MEQPVEKPKRRVTRSPRCNYPYPNDSKINCRKSKGHSGNHKTWSNVNKSFVKEWSNATDSPDVSIAEETGLVQSE